MTARKAFVILQFIATFSNPLIHFIINLKNVTFVYIVNFSENSTSE